MNERKVSWKKKSPSTQRTNPFNRKFYTPGFKNKSLSHFDYTCLVSTESSRVICYHSHRFFLQTILRYSRHYSKFTSWKITFNITSIIHSSFSYRSSARASILIFISSRIFSKIPRRICSRRPRFDMFYVFPLPSRFPCTVYSSFGSYKLADPRVSCHSIHFDWKVGLYK